MQERRRIEAVKRRQEREIQRMVEGEEKMTVLQQKLLQGEQDEIRRLKEHEKKVEEERRVEIERKKERSGLLHGLPHIHLPFHFKG